MTYLKAARAPCRGVRACLRVAVCSSPSPASAGYPRIYYVGTKRESKKVLKALLSQIKQGCKEGPLRQAALLPLQFTFERKQERIW